MFVESLNSEIVTISAATVHAQRHQQAPVASSNQHKKNDLGKRVRGKTRGGNKRLRSVKTLDKSEKMGQSEHTR